MTITELIEELKKIRSEKGDLTVVTCDEDGYRECIEVEVLDFADYLYLH